MPEDVVEDVGLGKVVDLRPGTDDDGGGEPPLRQQHKELVRGDEAVDRHGVPPGARLQPGVGLGEVGHPVRAEADGFRSLQEDAAAGAPQLPHPLLVQDAPHRMVLRGVRRPLLLDEDGGVDGGFGCCDGVQHGFSSGYGYKKSGP